MKKNVLLWLWCAAFSCAAAATPVDGLLERIDEGASKKFVIENNRRTLTFLNSTKRAGKWWCAATPT